MACVFSVISSMCNILQPDAIHTKVTTAKVLFALNRNISNFNPKQSLYLNLTTLAVNCPQTTVNSENLPSVWAYLCISSILPLCICDVCHSLSCFT